VSLGQINLLSTKCPCPLVSSGNSSVIFFI
jgi:hypothetical protein